VTVASRTTINTRVGHDAHVAAMGLIDQARRQPIDVAPPARREVSPHSFTIHAGGSDTMVGRVMELGQRRGVWLRKATIWGDDPAELRHLAGLIADTGEATVVFAGIEFYSAAGLLSLDAPQWHLSVLPDERVTVAASLREAADQIENLEREVSA
jgi:hypothetical protein